MHFTPLVDFWSDETQSQYCAGLGYYANNDKLLALVAAWIAEGKVAPAAPASSVTGKA